VGFARNGLLVLRTIDSGQYQFFVAGFWIEPAKPLRN
jgi:hypothetical protein